MMRLDQVSKCYRTAGRPVTALEEVGLEVRAGEYLVVRGASGSGKTTLLLTLGGMLRPSTGRVWWGERDLYGLTTAERASFRRKEVGFVFQMFHLVPYLSVLDNVLLAACRDDPKAEGAATGLLTNLGLGPRLRHKPGQLSAGERQRAALARALLNQPRLILADEPTGNLDPENAEEVFRCLREYHYRGGTVVVVTHGPALPDGATRTVRLLKGRLTQDEGSGEPAR